MSPQLEVVRVIYGIMDLFHRTHMYVQANVNNLGAGFHFSAQPIRHQLAPFAKLAGFVLDMK